MKETTMKKTLVEITFDSGETRTVRASSNNRVTALNMALNVLPNVEQNLVKKVEFLHIME